MVLIFFGDELGDTETDIVVLAEKKKNQLPQELVDVVLKTRVFLWPRQWGICLLLKTQFVPFISLPAHAGRTQSQWGTLQIDRSQKIYKGGMKGRKKDV